ncbi:hypothetical protein HYR54_12610 [Candidatus Acetothermia bacterium]|nr:hypothetical protein [Candidatus Acetothermia bacterium]
MAKVYLDTSALAKRFVQERINWALIAFFVFGVVVDIVEASNRPWTEFLYGLALILFLPAELCFVRWDQEKPCQAAALALLPSAEARTLRSSLARALAQSWLGWAVAGLFYVAFDFYYQFEQAVTGSSGSPQAIVTVILLALLTSITHLRQSLKQIEEFRNKPERWQAYLQKMRQVAAAADALSRQRFGLLALKLLATIVLSWMLAPVLGRLLIPLLKTGVEPLLH